jgi:hypothetical protein
MKSKVRWTTRAAAQTLLLFACATGFSQAQTPAAPPPPDCVSQLPDPALKSFTYYDFNEQLQSYQFWAREKLCYGNGDVWPEPTTLPSYEWLTERASIWTATDPRSDGKGTKRPLIIWTHPNGQTEDFAYTPNGHFKKTENILLDRVLVPAMQAGYALASLEFRHPAASYIPDNRVPVPPSTDVRDAIQYIRANAAALHIDPDNIFLVGQSRGSLNMLWAIRDDDAQGGSPSPAWRSQSTKVRAVWDYQAQTCYQKERVKTAFILAADQPLFESDARNPDLPAGDDPGCAFDDVGTVLPQSIPPFRIMYDEQPVDIATVTRQHWCTSTHDDVCFAQFHDADSQWNTYFDRHDANFGVAMWLAYKKGNYKPLIKTCYGVTSTYDDPSGPYNGYQGYTQFFDANRTVPVVGAAPPDCPVVVHVPTPGTSDAVDH